MGHFEPTWTVDRKQLFISGWPELKLKQCKTGSFLILAMGLSPGTTLTMNVSSDHTGGMFLE